MSLATDCVAMAARGGLNLIQCNTDAEEVEKWHMGYFKYQFKRLYNRRLPVDERLDALVWLLETDDTPDTPFTMAAIAALTQTDLTELNSKILTYIERSGVLIEIANEQVTDHRREKHRGTRNTVATIFQFTDRAREKYARALAKKTTLSLKQARAHVTRYLRQAIEAHAQGQLEIFQEQRDLRGKDYAIPDTDFMPSQKKRKSKPKPAKSKPKSVDENQLALF